MAEPQIANRKSQITQGVMEVLLRKHPSDEARIEMGTLSEDGGIKVITSVHVDEARRVFGDDAIRALEDLKSGEWFEASLSERFDADE